jgi:hypothetical protein
MAVLLKLTSTIKMTCSNKQLRPDWTISRDKFIAILNAFKAKDIVNRRFINELQSTQRMQWGKLLFHPEFGSYSLDDENLTRLTMIN